MYNINIPVFELSIPSQPNLMNYSQLSKSILQQSTKVAWTSMSKNRYGRLFAPVEDPSPDTEAEKEAEDAGPAAVATHSPSVDTSPSGEIPGLSPTRAFRFKPDISLLINPMPNMVVPGTDIHALHSGWCSVTPIRATFELGEISDKIETEEDNGKGLWKL